MAGRVIPLQQARIARQALAAFDELRLPEHGIETTPVEGLREADWPVRLTPEAHAQVQALFAQFGLDGYPIATQRDLFGNFNSLFATQMLLRQYREADEAWKRTWMSDWPDIRAEILALDRGDLDELRRLHRKHRTFERNAAAW